MESEKTYTLKEAKDLLRHIHQQRLDYCSFPSHVERHLHRSGGECGSGSKEEVVETSAWLYYEELPSRSKFLLLYHILNEKVFKTTVLDLLSLIKVSRNRLMNSSFLCLGNHIEHVHDTSISNLGDSAEGNKTLDRTAVTTKPIMTGLAGNRMIELDSYFSWHPETSEYLLAHITVPSSCGGADHFPAHISNLQIMPSSRVCLPSSQLGIKVRALIQEEMRSIPVHRTSSSTVEDKIAAMAKMKHQGSLHGADKSLLATRTTQYPDIIAFSLAALIASQLSRGVQYFYHQHLTKVAEATLHSLYSPAPLLSTTPSFTASTPEAERCFLQMHVATSCEEQNKSVSLVLSSSFVQNYWDMADSGQKSSLLRSMGFLESGHESGSSTTSKSTGKLKGKKGGNSVTGKRGSATAGSGGVSAELLRADFRRFMDSINSRTFSYLQQETEPLLASQSDVSNDWWDIEEGTRDEESLSRFQALVKVRGPEYDFEQWCLTQHFFGAGLCEYVSTCALEKLFTPNHYWNSWSISAFQSLEKKWMVEEAERMLIAYEDDVTSSGTVTSDVVDSTSKRSSKSKKKQKKASKRKSASMRKSDNISTIDGVDSKHDNDDEEMVAVHEPLISPQNTSGPTIDVESDTTIVGMNDAVADSVGSISSIPQVCSEYQTQEDDPPPCAKLNADLCVSDFYDREDCGDDVLPVNTCDVLAEKDPGHDYCDDQRDEISDNEESVHIEVPLLKTDLSKVPCTESSVLCDDLDDDLDYTSSGVSSVVSSTTESECHRSLTTSALSACSSNTSTAATSVGAGVAFLDCPQSFTKALSDDIRDMAIALRSLADRRRPWQLGTIDKVKEITKSIWIHAEVDIFGSFSTGLAIPSSDVDIVICGVNSQQMQWFGGRWLSPMAILSQQLQQASWVTTLKTIENTAMPVIKVTTAPVPISANVLGSAAVRGIIKLDVSFSTAFMLPPHAGGQFATANGVHHGPVPATMHQGIATRDFVMKLCAMNHALIPLTLVLKQFLSEKCLHDPYTGGLTSYAVTIMVASILQPYVLEPPHTHPDLGTLFLKFFQKFGTTFDTRKHAVALAVNGPFVPLTGDRMPRVGSEGYWNPPDPVVVIDPLNSQNNLGRSCFAFRQLQSTLDTALEAGLQRLDRASLCPLTSILGVMFGAEHHNNVLKLVSQLWCPNEVVESAREDMSDEENDGKQLVHVSGASETLRPENNTTSAASNEPLRERCHSLLSQMTPHQLEEAHLRLLEVLQSSNAEHQGGSTSV